MSERRPALFHCHPCGHVWPALWTPLEMSKAAKLMKAGCPKCGEPRKLYTASPQAAETWRIGPRSEPCFVEARS